VAQVKGTLFVDYVRMLRAKKGVEWSRYLTPSDIEYLSARIIKDDWYPMAAFERMGLAILAEVAEGDVRLAREWGRMSIDWLCTIHPNLIAPGDPRESLMRFQVLRQSFFDYPALVMREISDAEANVVIAYGMGHRAEEAASWQTLGFFQRLLEVSGAKDVNIAFTSTSWDGGPNTVLSMQWT
jgi:hypothetical protein